MERIDSFFDFSLYDSMWLYGKVKISYELQISSVLDIQLNSWLYGFASVKNIYAYG